MSEAKPESPARPGVRELIEAIAGASGRRFFDVLCDALARSCGVRIALVAALEGDELVLVGRSGGARPERLRAPRSGGPWEAALAGAGFACERDAQASYPADPWVARAGAQSLAAAPIPARGGAPRGVLAVLDPEPLADPTRALSLLRFAALRVAAELERDPAPWSAADGEQSARGLAQAGSIVDALPDALLIVNSDGELVGANPAAHALFGHRAGGLAGTALATVLPGLRAEAKPHEIPLEARRADGSSFEGRIALRPHGELLLARVRDASAERTREEHLLAYAEVLERGNRDLDQARQKAEQAGDAKTLFLANMSHEIRTPLTAILGFAEIMLTEWNDPEPGTDREQALRAIHRNGSYLLQVLNEILHFSKLEAGEARPDLVDCSLLLLLSEVRSLFAFPARERELEFTVRIEGSVPETLRCDPVFVRQALVNLVGNALKFTQRGRVEVIARHLPAARLLEIEVRDSGVGIAREDLRRIFEPFQQADGSRTRRFGGTGLGLAIARRMIEALGGRIHVESEPGRGSRFRVALPASPPNGTSFVTELDDPGSESEGSLRRRLAALRLDHHVLVVEDGPDNQRVIRHILEKAGCHVTVAANGAEGLELARKQPPFDVILMDIQMPVLDGLEATRRLRASGYAGRIIALTAHAVDQERERALRAGCDDFATKPIDRLALLELLQRT